MTDILKQIESELADAEAAADLASKAADLANEKVAVLRETVQRLRPYYQSAQESAKNGSATLLTKHSNRYFAGAESATDGDLVGVVIEDAAMTVLRGRSNTGMTSQDIALEAIGRGYRSGSSRNPENDPNKIVTSFHVTMKRHPEKFDYDGKLFRLKEEYKKAD